MLSTREAFQGARSALAVANKSVESQISIYKALKAAAEAFRAKGNGQAKTFADLAVHRASLLIKVAANTVAAAERSFDETGVPGNLLAALKAAVLTRTAVDETDPKIAELKERLLELGSAEAH